MGIKGSVKRQLRPFAKQAAFQLSSYYDKPHLNLGGGPEFSAFKWDNLDGARGKYNPKPFDFGPETIVPFGDETKSVVYSSHFLEHVDPTTAKRVLAEAHRVLKPGGLFVLKVPDYDEIIAKWREGELAYFRYPNMALEEIVPTWKARNIPDSIDYRALVNFCGYWNDAWGDHFSKERKYGEGAYHGPPAIPQDTIKTLFTTKSPFEIAAYCREQALSECQDIHFNHQTAWSHDEIRTWVTEAGFTVESMDREKIRKTHKFIPGIDEMRRISMYIEAVRA